MMSPRLYAYATALLLALAVAQTGSLATVAAVIATAVLASAIVAVLVHTQSTAVAQGAKAEQRRQAAYEVPEPSHPDTAGRTRARAPGGVTQAA